MPAVAPGRRATAVPPAGGAATAAAPQPGDRATSSSSSFFFFFFFSFFFFTLFLPPPFSISLHLTLSLLSSLHRSDGLTAGGRDRRRRAFLAAGQAGQPGQWPAKERSSSAAAVVVVG